MFSSSMSKYPVHWAHRELILSSSSWVLRLSLSILSATDWKQQVLLKSTSATSRVNQTAVNAAPTCAAWELETHLFVSLSIISSTEVRSCWLMVSLFHPTTRLLLQLIGICPDSRFSFLWRVEFLLSWKHQLYVRIWKLKKLTVKKSLRTNIFAGLRSRWTLFLSWQ